MQPKQRRIDQIEKELSVSDPESILSTNCEYVEESSSDAQGNNRRETMKKKTQGRKSVWQDHHVVMLVSL